MRRCAICKKLKPSDSFSGRGSYCKPCQSEFARQWRIANVEHVKEKKRLQYQNMTPRQHWDHHLRARYGITIEQYDEMNERQNGVCAICLNACRRRRLSVDHCHKTGRIRGLLCDRCNSVLGRVDDDKELLRRAAKYLDEPVALRLVK